MSDGDNKQEYTDYEERLNQRIDDSKMFRNAFNAGYKMQKDKPELATKLSDGFANKEHPYSKGFDSGMKEHIKETRLLKLRNDRFYQEQQQIATERGLDR